MTRWEGNTITVAPGGYRSPGRLQVEGDWSGGAFWLCANALGAEIDCTGLDPASKQGDRRVHGALAAIRKGNATIPGRDIPDLIPALAVVAAGTPGTTRFTDIGRLRLKESDRIATTLALIEALGGSGVAGPDSLEIYGKDRLPGGVCDSCRRPSHRHERCHRITALHRAGHAAGRAGGGKILPGLLAGPLPAGRAGRMGGRGMSNTYGTRFRFTIFGQSHARPSA